MSITAIPLTTSSLGPPVAPARGGGRVIVDTEDALGLRAAMGATAEAAIEGVGGDTRSSIRFLE